MKKRTLVIIAIVLVLALVLSVLSCGYRNWNVKCWFGHNYADGICTRCGAEQPAEKPTEPEQPEQSNGNVVIETVAAQGMQLYAAPVALSDEAETYTLTATITPANADDKRVEWVVAWNNANSLWATGKTVTDYVTVTPTSEYALTATVACIKDFGEQVIVTVKSLDNEEAAATCTVDYVRRIKGINFDVTSWQGRVMTFTHSITYSNYTIAGELTLPTQLQVYIPEYFDFQEELQNAATQIGADYSYPHAHFEDNASGVIDWQSGIITMSEIDLPIDSSVDLFVPDGLVGAFCYYSVDFLDQNGSELDLFYIFRNALETYSELEIELDLSIKYNGKVYSHYNGRTSVYVDTSSMTIGVEGIEISQGSLVF